MNQQQDQQPGDQEMSACVFAKELLRVYVLRGDSLGDIRRSGMGWHRREMSAEVQGDKVLVFDRTWRTVARFKLAELYTQIQAEAREHVTQPSLFDGEVTP